MTIFFTADQHFWHTNIIKLTERPFSSVEEMNEALIARHNEVVGPDDDVIHLGDFCWKHSALDEVRGRLNGHKHYLVPGNHDGCHPMHHKSESAVRKYARAGFLLLPPEVTDRAIGLLCHFPYSGDPWGNDRYLQYRPKDEGRWLLHGHVHNLWRVKGRQINVGVDAWDYKPVALSELERIVHEEAPSAQASVC